jgi:hypothetical protein
MGLVVSRYACGLLVSRSHLPISNPTHLAQLQAVERLSTHG